MILYPISVGRFSPRFRLPKVDRCRRRTDCAAEGGGEHHGSVSVSGEPFFLVLIIFVVTTAVADGANKRWSTRGRSRRCHEGRALPGAVAEVSCSWL